MTACFTDKKEGIAPSYSVKLSSVGKRYCVKKNTTTQETFWALKDVSFTVRAGTILGVIGRNGAGKTTLLNMIAGILQPTEGAVSINASAVRGLFNLGVGFQDELSGRENIFLNGALLGASRKEIEVSMPSIIEFSELGKFIDMPLGSYSQGMRLRLGFSVVANLDFDLLVIDEVLAVGDALFQSKCYERIMDFKRKGKTLIITSQDTSMIERLCDEVMLIDHGCKLFSGRPKEAVDRYRMLLNTEKFFVGALPNVSAGMIKDTKKWADNISDWGKNLGSREIDIYSVVFLNRLGMPIAKIKSKGYLKVKVKFIAKNTVKDVHFGVAVFREDGVYCYGPNTKFDGINISEIKKGRGWFSIEFNRVLLGSGAYRVSIAIWDRAEKLAYAYHNGYYGLEIIGCSNGQNGLLSIPFSILSFWFVGKIIFLKKKISHFSISNEDFDAALKRSYDRLELRIQSIVIRDAAGAKKNSFFTNEQAEIVAYLISGKTLKKSLCLWIGIYRVDGIYCQGITVPVSRYPHYSILFPRFALLPGEYFISCGIWDKSERCFVYFSHKAYFFDMINNKPDHGTVFLEHKWKWMLP